MASGTEQELINGAACVQFDLRQRLHCPVLQLFIKSSAFGVLFPVQSGQIDNDWQKKSKKKTFFA